jgi:hypothetical protein
MFTQLWQEIAQLPQRDGISPADLLGLSEPLSLALRHMLQEGTMSLSRFAQELRLDPVQSGQLAQLLESKGYIIMVVPPSAGDAVYRVNLSRLRGRTVPLNF